MFKPPGKGRTSSWLIEILMIVVGINVALWFEGWFQDMQDSETERQYLADIRADLVSDIKALDKLVSAAEAKSKRAAELAEQMPMLGELPPREIARAIYVPASYLFFTPSDFTFRSMQESGDFRLLENDDIKKSILRLDRLHKHIDTLQSNYLQALDDGYLPLMMEKFDLATFEVTDPSLLEDQLFRNFFVYTRNDISAMAVQYREARSAAEKLIYLIDEYLGSGQ